MIRKLKIKFVALAMAALFVLLAVIVTGMNIINYNSVVADSDEILNLLSMNQGQFPDFGANPQWVKPPFMTIETPYESRYFSVLLDKNGVVLHTDTDRIKAIDQETAVNYASIAMNSKSDKDFIDNYRFVRYEEDLSIRIIFLDCGRKLYTYKNFLISSICMSLIGYISFFVVILFFCGKILKPVTESYEKQKRFITDAGHEIKTPLAIIKADADVLEMEYGENEWLDGIQAQIKRLSSLTADLVYLSKMEEADNTLPMIEFPFSDVVLETAQSFHALAQTQEKQFTFHVPPMLSYNGNEKAIRQLVNILLDNALKYSPEQGYVYLDVQKQHRQIQLTVFNTTEQPIKKENLEHLFDRFYRADASRNFQTGGYGIGLSVAQAIVTAHSGKITASTKDNLSLEISISFPI